MSEKKPVRSAYIHLEPVNQAWIDSRVAWILSEFGTEHIRRCPCILSDDPLLQPVHDESQFHSFCEQVARQMQLDASCIDFETATEILLDDSTRALGTYQSVGDRFLIRLVEEQLYRPAELIATLVHELCHVHLLGHERIDDSVKDHEPLTDLLGVFMGYGVVMANSVVYSETRLEGLNYYSNFEKRGYMTMPMYGYALAIFAKLRGKDGHDWTPHMRLDVRDAFSKSLTFLDRHGLPDFSVVPEQFSHPLIKLAEKDEAPKRELSAAFYPDDHEIEEADQPDFDHPVGSDGDGSGSNSECVYCGGVVEAEDEAEAEDQVVICAECRASIEEGEREAAEELRAYHDGRKYAKFVMMIGTISILIFLALFYIVSLIVRHGRLAQ